MARRRSDSDDDVSLFPFLSIIACVIGVLTLMISTLALAQLDTSVVAKAEEYEKAKEELADAQSELEALRQQLEAKRKEAEQKVDRQQQKFTQLRSQLDKLTQQLEKEQQSLEQQQEVEIVIPTIPEEQRETVDDLKSQLVQLREQIAQLEKTLDQRKQPPEEAEVSILPAGSGLDQNPFFVECTDGAIVIHHQAETTRIRAAEMAANEKFIGLMEKVAAGKQNILLFLVRSDGLGTYRAAKKLADSANVANGKLPVVGKGRIDLEYFKEKQ